MTIRQSVLKNIYPVLMKMGDWFGIKSGVISNSAKMKPLSLFYNLSAVENNGDLILFDKFRGRKVLLVNTASDCGYTGQYADLQKLQDEFNERLIILGFPSNDFKEQEKGSDLEIAKFCKVNFGVTFPLVKKSSVVLGENQNKVFEWLTTPAENGWNNKQPEWNFSKYLIDEQGALLFYFAPAVSPLSAAVRSAISSRA